ncbi:hypothetical protein J2S08_003139 [Bacillus chungangensis]|uniref:Uncharacterized protein n=1 Tax=Bacillus chungangensis TaxID=587633 RepID=A0ABT9WVM4_9BACI|nr:hypothetical protein [Bacillus chungangensis]
MSKKILMIAGDAIEKNNQMALVVFSSVMH